MSGTDTRPEPVSRTFWWWATAGLAALQLSHFFGRGFYWVVDTEWAVWEYLFSLIFFGPAVAGLAAWQGRSLNRSAWLLRGRPWQAVSDFFGEVLIIAYGVFASGLIFAWAASVWSGAQPSLRPGTYIDIALGFLALSAYAAVGFAVGIRVPAKPISAVTVVGTFALTMWGWVAGFESAFRLGGASAGLSDLASSWQVRLYRLVFWSAVIGISYLAASPIIAPLRRRRLVASIAGLAFAGCIAIGGSGSIPIFTLVDTEYVCTGDTPEMCVLKRFERYLEPLSQAVEANPVIRALVTASPRVSRVLGIGFSRDFRLFDLPPNPEREEELKDFIAQLALELCYPGCFSHEKIVESPDPFMDPDIWSKYMLLYEWTMINSGLEWERPPDAEPLPEGPPDSPEVQEWLRDILDQFPSCNE